MLLGGGLRVSATAAAGGGQRVGRNERQMRTRMGEC